MKVGVLYAKSNAHPGLSIQFLDGLNYYLEREGNKDEISIIPEGIGFGGDEKEVYAKAEILIVQTRIDVLIAYIDFKVLPILDPLLFASGIPVIVVNPGANFPLSWIPKPNIIHLSLHHAFLCGLTAHLAASKYKKGIIASTFYDCGYLHIASLTNNFTKADGAIQFNYINNQKYTSEFHIDELKDFINQSNEKMAVLAVMDSLPASLFYDRITQFEHGYHIDIYASPMMLLEDAFDKNNSYNNISLEGHIPWSEEVDNEENNAFISYLQEKKIRPSIFSLLGWETAMIVMQLKKISDEIDEKDGGQMIHKLKDHQFQSPRGVLILDDETHFFRSPVYHVVFEKENNTFKITPVDDLEKEWKDFTSETIKGGVSGWTNNYLSY